MDGAQVGVLEETDQVGLGRLLQKDKTRIRILEKCETWSSSYLEGSDGGGLESEVGLEVLGDLPHQALEGQLADEELRRLLVATDLTQGHGSGPVPVGLLDSAGGGGGLAGGLGGQLLPGGLASGGLAGGLLGTGHGEDAGAGGLLRSKTGQTAKTKNVVTYHAEGGNGNETGKPRGKLCGRSS